MLEDCEKATSLFLLFSFSPPHDRVQGGREVEGKCEEEAEWMGRERAPESGDVRFREKKKNQSDPWNKEASLCHLPCPRLLLEGRFGGPRILLSWRMPRTLCPSHCPTPPDLSHSPCASLPCPGLPAHCVGTSDFMVLLRRHLHPAALRSLPA